MMEIPLHPLLVHFPLVLLISAVVFDWVGHWRKRDVFNQMGFYLLIFGVAGAILAVITGNVAEDKADQIPHIGDALELHQDFATWTLILFSVLLLIRISLQYKNLFSGWRKNIYLGVSTVGLAMIITTGFLGGRLVFEYGAGTRLAPQAPNDTTGKKINYQWK